jgi:hypothetical protein
MPAGAWTPKDFVIALLGASLKSAGWVRAVFLVTVNKTAATIKADKPAMVLNFIIFPQSRQHGFSIHIV